MRVIAFVICFSIDQSKPDLNATLMNIFWVFFFLKDLMVRNYLKFLLEELGKNGLKLENMKGQSYDKDSHMRGDKLGVKSRIKTLNP